MFREVLGLVVPPNLAGCRKTHRRQPGRSEGPPYLLDSETTGALRFARDDSLTALFGSLLGGAVWLWLVICLGPAWGWGQAQEPPVAAGVETSSTTKELPAQITNLAEVLARERSDYVVSPEDTLDVFIMDVPEVSRAYRVSTNGSLTMPLLPEPIPAMGLTLNQLSRLIATKFRESGMLNNAQVLVSVHETRLHSVIVSGSVKKPAAYPVYGPTRLLDLLTQAGGLADDAGTEIVVRRGVVGARAQELENTSGGPEVFDTKDSKETLVPGRKPVGTTVREESDAKDSKETLIAGRTQVGPTEPEGPDAKDPKETTFTLDIQNLVKTGDEESNILLYPGDRIVVQRATLIYILGAVNRPGGYALHDPQQQMTVMKVLALAGDVNSVAKKKHILILRNDPAAPGGKRQEIPVDFKAMLFGKIADMRLQPDDILFIPSSAKAKTLQTAAGLAIGTSVNVAAGLIVYHY